MIAHYLAPFLLAGSWPATIIGPPVLKDVNGVTFAVGQTVKIIGVITKLDNTDRHGLELTIQPNNPSTLGQIQHGYDGGPISPLPGKPVIQCAALNAIVGS
jgi:hypothetical protein